MLVGAIAMLTWMAVLPAATSTTSAPRFTIDPVGDSALLAGTSAFALVLELITSTGELKAQAPGDPNALLPIDRPIAEASPSTGPHGTISTVLVGAAFVYVLADTVRAGLSDTQESFITDFTLYAESAVFNLAMTDLVKIAVRRPRPVAYQQLRVNGMVEPGTDSALSFYSGHTSMTAALSATAAYLAFARDPEGIEGWLVAGGGLALTALVGVERVLAGAHFPTDVIAGAIAGGSMGTMVPYLHRVHGDSAVTSSIRVSGFTGENGATGLSIFGAF